jgi:RimJ/RimL family protein N-acetyltransferase
MKKNSDIIIRRAKVGDEKKIAEMMKEGFKRKFWVYAGVNSPPDKKRLKKMRDEYKKKSESFTFVAIDKQSNKVIGSCSFIFKPKGELRHRGEMGWGVHPDYAHHGLGTKLVRTMLDFVKKKGFKRAEAEMAIENKASWKLALDFGFKIEGKKKKALLTDDGRYIDTYIVGKNF